MDQRPSFGSFGRAQQASGQTGSPNPWAQGDVTQGSYAGVGYQAPQPVAYNQTAPQQPMQQQPNAGMWQQAGGFGQQASPQGGYSQVAPQQAGAQPMGAQQPTADPMPQGAWPAQGTAWQNNGGQPWPESVYNGQPRRRHRIRIDSKTVLGVLACAVMPLLLVIALVVHAGWLTILTAALAVAMLTILWLSQAFERPTNIMISVLYAAALVVAIILTVNAQGKTQNRSGGTAQVNTASLSGSSLSFYNWVTQGNPSVSVTNPDASTVQQVLQSQEEDLGTFALQEEQNNGAIDASVEVSDRFLTYWQENLQESMVNLCSRSWSQSLKSSTTPRIELFSLLRNRTMLSFEFVSVTGSINDQRRTVTYYADMYPPGSTIAARYVLKVDVVQEGGQWYVDPRSMESNAPTPSPTPAVSLPTQPPDPPEAALSTVLYYNPDGGKLYHLDPYCSSAKPEYLPFKGHFTYAEINDPAYKNLTPCTMCGAPLRYN
ncbi:MAG: hypothetical protein IK127_01510 [Clostridia bacterium]|nr:hypothetical protein [Clostridia bacterium]